MGGAQEGGQNNSEQRSGVPSHTLRSPHHRPLPEPSRPPPPRRPRTPPSRPTTQPGPRGRRPVRAPLPPTSARSLARGRAPQQAHPATLGEATIRCLAGPPRRNELGPEPDFQHRRSRLSIPVGLNVAPNLAELVADFGPSSSECGQCLVEVGRTRGPTLWSSGANVDRQFGEMLAELLVQFCARIRSSLGQLPTSDIQGQVRSNFGRFRAKFGQIW